MNKKSPPLQLATPNDLKEAGRHEIATNLNPLVADAFALYVKTKNFHWHLSGPHFRDYHLLFDEQAAQIFEMVDVIAERVRKLGQTTIRSISHIQNLKIIEDSEDVFLSAEQMIQELLQDNRLMCERMRAAHHICSKNEDCASTSLLEVFIDQTERRAWFLFETISDSVSSENVVLR